MLNKDKWTIEPLLTVCKSDQSTDQNNAIMWHTVFFSIMLGSILILTEGYKPDSASVCCSHSIILMQ